MPKSKPNLNPHFLEFSKFLNAHSVRYLRIGGHAVGYHGWARNTKDIDFWIASDRANQLRVIAAMRAYGFAGIEDNALQEDDAMLRFGVAPLRVGIVKRIRGLDFDAAWDNTVLWEDEHISIPVMGLVDLRKNKLATGRPSDLADLSKLRSS